ncbi:ppGpp synthetase/RelA/SpoT-type nucleotidyltransferase [Saccharothrix saharensis]|uniref:PpGpp synthetase/RelA/SpoT-type nucleotidyltransferase n=1 Tax=Saccharothrix saharensis TaxID=571190 RepID=A0A543JK22_9PSEU|nr:hypothetical protein [Saccharothrix saharensis]TQM83202.1 ppGpp synthetase/RelA/SpoT-type nucleotidyltransferase [Saccharothrix saharensis]
MAEGRGSRSGYDENKGRLEELGQVATRLIGALLVERGIRAHNITFRVKEKSSADRKMSNNPQKYSDYLSLTDFLGVRVITNFADEVDVVGSILQGEFTIDEDNSIDKRLVLDSDRFGYLSLHYILQLNQARRGLAEYARYGGIKFEVQVRSILQHAWAEIEHDLGYKSTFQLPSEVKRRFSRLAGLLEIADSEFQSLRDHIASYEHAVSDSIPDSSSDLVLNQATLMTFLERSPMAIHLDVKLAEFLGSSEMFVDPKYAMQQLAPLVSHFGIRTVGDLDAAFERDGSKILPFVEKLFPIFDSHLQPPELPVRHRKVSVGICLLQLTYLLMAGADPDVREEVIREYFGSYAVDAKGLDLDLLEAYRQAFE